MHVRMQEEDKMPKAVFRYPIGFMSLSEYNAHRDQLVEITRELVKGDEYDFEGELMYEIRAEDGWTGYAFDSELERIKDREVDFLL